MSNERKSDSRSGRRLSTSSDSKAKQILARSLYNEFVKSRWSRSEILEYVNILLDLVIRADNASLPSPAIDVTTGFVTRLGFQELLRHELDPATERRFPSCLLLVKVVADKDTTIAAEILRNALRVGDVVAPLGNHLTAVMLNVQLSLAEDISKRLCKRLVTRLGAPVDSALRSLEPETRLRSLWIGMLRELQAQQREGPG